MTRRRVKIISLGDPNVGKSCLIKRFCESRFISEYIATIGVDYGVKDWLDDTNNEVRINFWDLAGEDVYALIRNEFYQDTEGILLVFDVQSRRSFERLDKWLEEMAVCLNKTKSDLMMETKAVLIGNKSDGAVTARQVSESEAQAYARLLGVSSITASKQWEQSEAVNGGLKEVSGAVEE